MKRTMLFALVCAALAFAGYAQASEVPNVLSASDARTYRAVFEAQRAGNIGKARELTDDLTDKSLKGYVLALRYLEARHYRTTFSELKSWLETYADLPPAERIYRLALKHRPNRRTAVPAPISVHWRTASGDETAPIADAPMQTALGARTQARFRSMVRDDDPDAANTILKTLSPGSDITQADIDRLSAQVAASYLAEGRAADALALAESTGDHGSVNAPMIDWLAGIAAYRTSDYTRAAKHFETLMDTHGIPNYTLAAAAFWAARSYMRANHPDGVINLYATAASQPHTFYGAMASRLLGQNLALNLTEPSMENTSFAALMRNRPAHRAVALHQIGMSHYAGDEMMRAYSEIDPDQATALAALARYLGNSEIELKSSLIAQRRGIYLTTLYPVPSYAPRGGYQLDTTLMLAFARQESGFNDDAVSHSGARGVMQMMPKTAAAITGNRKLARRQKKKLDDPEYNMTLGQKYLLDLLDNQNGNLFMLAAAYNAGPGNLSRWLAQSESNNDPLLFIETIPIPETRRYVKQVMLNLWMYNERFSQHDATLDDAAAGRWPVYSGYAKTAALQ